MSTDTFTFTSMEIHQTNDLVKYATGKDKFIIMNTWIYYMDIGQCTFTSSGMAFRTNSRINVPNMTNKKLSKSSTYIAELSFDNLRSALIFMY
jgi:hypothetical protein